MVVDHVGYVFFPQQVFFRIIGRLTMPIMAFFAAEGFRRTRSRTKYLIRLFIFAVVSEIPFRLAFSLTPAKPLYPSNVIFTIFLGVTALTIAEVIEKKTEKPIFRLIPYAICMYAAHFFYTDWNWLGVLMIIGFYHSGKSRTKQFLYLGGAYLLFILAEWISAFHKGTLVYGLSTPLHLFGLISLIFIFLYNGKRGCPRALGYLFYVFYPAHLILLYLINIII